MDGNKMIKVLFITCMYNRPKISELFLMAFARLKKEVAQYGFFDLELLVAVSDTASVEVCARYKQDYFVTNNFPLGTKWNELGRESLHPKRDWDYVFITGDDDFFDAKLFTLYEIAVLEKKQYFGVDQLYFYSPKNNRARQFRYQYQCSKLVGCGRMISRIAFMRSGQFLTVTAVKEFNFDGYELKKGDVAKMQLYKAEYLRGLRYVQINHDSLKFELWRLDQSSGLDGESEMKLLSNGYDPFVIPTIKPLILDIKSDQNIWSIESLDRSSNPVAIWEATTILHANEITFVNDNLAN